jgi:nitric oxide reductase subunit B
MFSVLFMIGGGELLDLVGAGILGFLINTPLALYYMQGLNLTPPHGHTALFGVYGMLGLGLLLFRVRGLKPDGVWNEDLLRSAFWCLNVGLALMSLLTLLPLGLLQLHAALENGYRYARAAEFLGQPLIEVLVWMRVPGDTMFSVGALLLACLIARQWIRPAHALAPHPSAA